jgi:hypothetical protein
MALAHFKHIAGHRTASRLCIPHDKTRKESDTKLHFRRFLPAFAWIAFYMFLSIAWSIYPCQAICHIFVTLLIAMIGRHICGSTIERFMQKLFFRIQTSPRLCPALHAPRGYFQ